MKFGTDGLQIFVVGSDGIRVSFSESQLLGLRILDVVSIVGLCYERSEILEVGCPCMRFRSTWGMHI